MTVCDNCAKMEQLLKDVGRTAGNRKTTIRRMAKELDALRAAVSDARRALRGDGSSRREAMEAAVRALKIDYSKLKLNETGKEGCCLG